jgi:GNAT superfamily N-acetyltransferase
VVNIVPFVEIASPQRERIAGEATEIFYETAYTRSFPSPEAKDEFHKRWFGHYLDTYPASFLLALDARGGAAVGYLAGCIDSFSEAARVIIAGIPNYTPAFLTAARDYPSHFHINVKPGHQGQGVGRLLVEHFIRQCQASGSPGIHVVTGAASRAVKFYEGCGFKRAAPFADADPGVAVLLYAVRTP